MISKLDPAEFDKRIEEIVKAKEVEAAAKAIVIPPPLIESPIIEEITPVEVNPSDRLRKLLRNVKRLDARVVYTLLHRDIFWSLFNILDCKDLNEISEAAYIIYDKIKPVDWRILPDKYFYEVAHGEYLGNASWYELVQSYLLYESGDSWLGVPIVQNNRYKPIKAYDVHTRVTGYVLQLSPDLRDEVLPL